MFAPPLQPFQQLSPGTRSGPLPPLTTNQAWPTNVPVPRNANGAEGWSR